MEVGDLGNSVYPFAITKSRKSVEVVKTENGSPSFDTILARTSAKGFSFLKKSEIFFVFLGAVPKEGQINNRMN